MSGASLNDVQKQLGHSDVSMTQRYTHLVEVSLQMAKEGVSLVIVRASTRWQKDSDSANVRQ